MSRTGVIILFLDEWNCQPINTHKYVFTEMSEYSHIAGIQSKHTVYKTAKLLQLSNIRLREKGLNFIHWNLDSLREKTSVQNEQWGLVQPKSMTPFKQSLYWYYCIWKKNGLLGQTWDFIFHLQLTLCLVSLMHTHLFVFLHVWATSPWFPVFPVLLVFLVFEFLDLCSSSQVSPRSLFWPLPVTIIRAVTISACVLTIQS